MTELIDKDEFELAKDVQEETCEAMHNAMKILLDSQSHLFSDNPLTLPTLHLAALCLYLRSYIESFPNEIKEKVITLAFETIGFSADLGSNDLAHMEIMGNA